VASTTNQRWGKRETSRGLDLRCRCTTEVGALVWVWFWV
jgi:hypothetical protein